MQHFAPLAGLIGGVLIGLAATLLLIFNGRVAGVSGIAGGAIAGVPGDRLWRVLFVLGLLAGGALAYWQLPERTAVTVDASYPVLLLAGLLVGFGTRLGSGCTSGHGVCGVSRLSLRSIIATVVFMAAGFTTVYVVRHVF